MVVGSQVPVARVQMLSPSPGLEQIRLMTITQTRGGQQPKMDEILETGARFLLGPAEILAPGGGPWRDVCRMMWRDAMAGVRWS